ncbi:helix-turn-helix domain-containing protein [Proteus sp. G2618]|uniref:helix-turn-helix transcriptional regulator n=1 Tax=Proteus sp. G2618 TaxID=2698841 RepID=UPI00137865CF|nr:helix-turn-helix transcriptional regulator [Proteus sp. G2618]NBN71272.1 helix-turn-helix domain-containing protein [Proteus sp. G2618]
MLLELIYERSRHKSRLFFKKARKEKKLSGRELAKIISVSQQQIFRYENGKNSMSLSLINKLLIIFDKSWDDLNREVISTYNEKVPNTQSKKRDYKFSDTTISQLN